MMDIDLEPNLATYGAAMSACDLAAAWTSAISLVQDMLPLSFSANLFGID